MAVNGDTLDEDDETFTVTLSNPTVATLSDATGTGKIIDDDEPPGLGVDDATVTEGDAGTVNATFTVSLSTASGQAVTVDWAAHSGPGDTATEGTDYTTGNGTLTFSAGDTSKTFDVAVNGDTLDETDETFTVTLSGPGNATLSDATGTGTIDDDDGPGLGVDDVTVDEGDSGTVNATFTASLSAASVQAVTVDWAAHSGPGDTATPGTDYTTGSGTLTFSAGETEKSIDVAVNGDTLDEDDETFTVTLSDPGDATLSDATGTGKIIDDDDLPGLGVDDVTVAEGNSGTVNATFTVSLSAASGRRVTVDWAAQSGAGDTATVGTDYTAGSGTLTFSAGETEKSIDVAVNGDTLDEDDETFTVTLSDPGDATLSDATGTGTIKDDDDPPSLGVDNVTVAEGNSGTVNATFTVTLSAASGQAVTVDWSANSGTGDTATEGTDYATGSGTLTFSAGETEKTIDVAVNGDTVDEVDETFTVTLSGPGNATLSDAAKTGTGTIDDDDGPGLGVDDVTVLEGDAGTVNATFTATLSAASAQVVTVDWAAQSGKSDTATAGADYTAGSGTLTFSAGDTSKTFDVAVTGDTTVESDETFTVTLSNPSDATLSDATGTGTIVDDDGARTLGVDDVEVDEGDSGTVNATFTVSLSGPSGRTVTVAWAANSGTGDTATEGTDYTTGSGTLTFSAGETEKSIDVAVNGDTLDEPDETFTVTLSNQTIATLSDATGTGTIKDDDDTPSLGVDDVTVIEGDSGTVNTTFTVSLSTASGQAVTVAWSAQSGTGDTATVGMDYTAGSGTLTFSAGETEKSIDVAVIGDTLDEPDETFTVTLSSPGNATLSDATGTGTIDDDDGPGLGVDNVTVDEGDTGTVNATFTVSLSAASVQAVTVAWATSDATATQPADYTAGSGTLTFSAGETEKSIDVAVIGDTVDELDETFTVTLSDPGDATLSVATGTGTIVDDDGPGLGVDDVTVIEGNTGTVNATFTVTLSTASVQAVTVAWATSDATATEPADYTAGSGALTFSAGETEKNIDVAVIGDTLDEDDETFTVMLSNPTNASLSVATGTGTIKDDDRPRSLSVNDVTVTEGDTGTVNATFTVTLSGPSGRTVTVEWEAHSGPGDTATAGTDYTAGSGALTFSAGETEKDIDVAVTRGHGGRGGRDVHGDVEQPDQREPPGRPDGDRDDRRR